MSTDTVDDLHYAEDLACRLQLPGRVKMIEPGKVSERSLMRCPDCNKRGVSVRLGSDDHYGCRYCDFYAFTGGYDDVDVRNRQRLLDLNPDHPLRPAGRVISHTVRVNVYDGTIRVDLPSDDDTAAWDDLTEPDGGVFNGTTIEPWGEDEEDMGRADTALAEFGFERVGPWSDEEYPTATIRRSPERSA